MNIEQNIFQRSLINEAKLKPYGFVKIADKWVYETTFFNGDFKAVITIETPNKISGEVLENATNDVFLPLRIESMKGFIAEVRAEYIKILQNIRENCCTKNYFMYPQSNRLTGYIAEKFNDNPVFPWEKFSGYGVFKNPNNNKWYALIANIDYNKLDKKKDGEVEVINLKLQQDKIEQLLKQKGFYPAYHMNKKKLDYHFIRRYGFGYGFA